MRLIFRYLLSAIIALGCWSGLHATNKGDEKSIERDIITRNYDVYGFTGIKSAVVGNIILTQTFDKQSSLTISGEKRYIDQIKVQVKSGILYIDGNTKKNRNNSVNNGLTITISSPDINSLTLEGVGNITCKTGIKAASFTINNQGVGNINIEKLDCTDITVKTGGVGNITLSGTTFKAELKTDGVGNINAEDLKAETLKATSNGIGNITCYATEKLQVSLNGMGSIRYKGNPKDKNLSRNGFGKIRQM